MNSGDFVYVDYVGRVKGSGEIFDLTKEDVAKKENVYNSELKYGPVPMVVGADFVLPGLNDALKEMNVGEKKTVEIKSERGFGGRNLELIKLIPEARFKEQDIEARPGNFVTVNRMRGRIISADGGRVKVDFNHPLAGKTLEYELEIVSKIEEQTEKVKAVVYYFTSIGKEDADVRTTEATAEVEFKKHFNITREVKDTIAKNIIKWIKPIERVKFVDVFGNE
jgi:peptidylprolyl isomerase/FKBP-type peptidyl-prolyl cis-trans isomerase SlyD